MKVHPKNILLYHLPKFRRLNSPLQISQFDPAEFRFGKAEPDRHTFYAIFWITGGEGVHSIDFESYEIRPNSLFLLAPGQIHIFNVDYPLKGHRLFFEDDWLQINPSTTIRDFFEKHKQSPVLYLDKREAQQFERYILMLYEEFNQLFQDSQEFLSHLLQLLLLQIERFYKNRYLQDQPDQNRIATDFQKLVEEKFFEEHRLAPYANYLGITSDYLSERIKEILGVSPSKLIHQRLVVEAKRLLAFTDLTSGEISSSLGFNDSAYFSRFFKRETSQTPLQFRANIREKYNHSPE